MLHDDAGKITFRIALPALAALPENMFLLLPLNTDLKLTGSSGIDFSIGVNSGVAVLTTITASGAGASFIPRSLTTTFEPGLVKVSINRRDLGDTRALIAGVISAMVKPDGSLDLEANTDLAPVDAGWTYALKLPTKLLVRSANLSPGRPAAGGFLPRRGVRPGRHLRRAGRRRVGRQGDVRVPDRGRQGHRPRLDHAGRAGHLQRLPSRRPRRGSPSPGRSPTASRAPS